MFVSHAKADDLFEGIKFALIDLKVESIVQVSMKETCYQLEDVSEFSKKVEKKKMSMTF